MKIRDRIAHDSIADIFLPDAYLRWAIESAQAVIGREELARVLDEARLSHFVDILPLDDLTGLSRLKTRDFTNLFTSVLVVYGEEKGRNVLIQIGHGIGKQAIVKQGKLFDLATMLASQTLPTRFLIKLFLTNLQRGILRAWNIKGQDNKLRLRVEERGDNICYVTETCTMCAGKEADAAICTAWNGVIAEGLEWLTARQFHIVETECRSMGAPACVWEIDPTPIEA